MWPRLRTILRTLLFVVGGSAGVWLLGQGMAGLGATCRSSLFCNPHLALLYGAVAGLWLSRQVKPWPRLDEDAPQRGA